MFSKAYHAAALRTALKTQKLVNSVDVESITCGKILAKMSVTTQAVSITYEPNVNCGHLSRHEAYLDDWLLEELRKTGT